jgi:hypothetical protein
MAWSIVFILVFGIALLVPTVWAIVGVATGRKRFWPCVAGAAWALALMLVTFIGMATDWGGCDAETDIGTLACGEVCKPDVWSSECGRTSAGCPAIPAGQYCPAGVRPTFAFCEPFQDGPIKQPSATWSDLSFIASGLWLLWWMAMFARPGTMSSGATSVTTTADNPMIVAGWLSITYAFIVIFMGPPSMWFHASMKNWGGWFDSISVVVWLGFNAVYVGYTLLFAMWGNGRGAARPIAVLAATAALVVVFGSIGWAEPSARLFGYIVAGGLWGIAEVVYIFVAAYATGVEYRRTWWMFLVNFGILATTMTVWVLFNDAVVSQEACQSREDIPGHAFFHILASVSTAWTFFDFGSERRVA